MVCLSMGSDPNSACSVVVFQTTQSPGFPANMISKCSDDELLILTTSPRVGFSPELAGFMSTVLMPVTGAIFDSPGVGVVGSGVLRSDLENLKMALPGAVTSSGIRSVSLENASPG